MSISANWNENIDEVDQLIGHKHFKQAMQEAASLMEQLLRYVYAQVASHVNASEQQKLAAATAKVSAGKPVGEMTLGQLVGLFREGKVFDLAEPILKKKLPHLKGADFNTFVEIRNRTVHKGEDVSEEEAKFFAAQLRLFLKSTGLLVIPSDSTGTSSTASTKSLKPWTELVKLHADVESGSLAESVFAIDLGVIAEAQLSKDGRVPVPANISEIPKVYLDAGAFFAATFPTTDWSKLLEEALASLAGGGTYNRVLKLRSPFGGGKSHTLLSMFHAARSRDALDQIDGCKGYARPGKVDVAVFDGEKFTATGGKQVVGGKNINTMWGWLAWQIGPKAFAVVEKHDQDRVSPAGDEVRAMLTAEGRPVLLLLDEVLKYMERAAAVGVQDSTLQRQAKDFLQNLTVEVAGSKTAVMVYSLQWSAREALANVALLQELDKLTSRVDQVREPVTGDEVLSVVKRRLLDGDPPAKASSDVASEYVTVVGGMWKARADSNAAKQEAEEHAIQLKSRMTMAYPFHPALIDVMNGRWTSVDGFQRTRGALRFLASCLHALKKRGGAKPLLGPAEIPLGDADVARAMMKDLDPKQDYSPVLMHDLVGPNARAKRIDDRLAKETPALANVRPATRMATAILAYSFGGLKRNDGDDVLPPGVGETELFAACIGPDLDSITASAVLGELRNSCLYLHYDGVRYAFKKDPNVTKLIEDAEQEVSRDPTTVRDRIRDLLDARLAGKDAIVWPESTQDLPDKQPRFLIGYLPLEVAGLNAVKQDEAARAMLSKYGDTPRRYRNGVGLAIPEKKPIESLRRAVRYLIAVERVEAKRTQHRLTKDQTDQLKERKRTEEAAAETSFRQLYPAVWLPRVGAGGALDLEKIEVGGRPLQATGMHERLFELLTNVGPKKVFDSIAPKKIVERMKLGEAAGAGEQPRVGIATSAVLDAFFEFLDPPRIGSDTVLRTAIVRGIGEGAFAYVTGNPSLGTDGKYQIALDKVTTGSMSEDEVDLDSGFLMIPSAIPAPPSSPTGSAPSGTTSGVTTATGTGGGAGSAGGTAGATGGAGTTSVKRTAVRVTFRANRNQLFKTFPAMANLADKSEGSSVVISIEGTALDGFDPGWLRNAVQEPLDEASLDDLKVD